MPKDSVALVIPVYNEQECIEKVLTDWTDELERIETPYQLYVVNDGSRDNTGEILNNVASQNSNIVVIHQENQGHGIAVKNGYIAALKSECSHIFQTDSDDQFSPQDFKKLWDKRNDSQAVFGHRLKRHDPLHRKVISFILRKMLFDFFLVDIPDANIPYRLFEKRFLKSVLATLTPGLFAPNVFLSILSFKYLKSCPVIPVSHFERQGTEAKLIRWGLIKACFKSAWDLIVFSYQLNKKIQYISESQQYEPSEEENLLQDESSPVAA